MNWKVYILILPLFFLSACSMSGNVNNQKPSSLRESNLLENPAKTFKDEFGYDTGMSKEEFDKFKEKYKSVYNASDLDFYNKIDLSKKNVLDSLVTSKSFCSYKEYKDLALKSQIIIVGEVKPLELSKDGVSNEYPTNYLIKLDKVLKGQEIINNELGFTPEFLEYPTMMNWDIWGVENWVPIFNNKGIYFFGCSPVNGFWRKENGNWLLNISGATILNINDNQAVTRSAYSEILKAKKLRESIEKNKSDNSKYTPSKEEWLAAKKLQLKSYERELKDSNNHLMKSDMIAYENIKKSIELVENGGDFNLWGPQQFLDYDDFIKIEKSGVLQESFDEVINNIIKIIDINDHMNFYKTDFKVKE